MAALSEPKRLTPSRMKKEIAWRINAVDTALKASKFTGDTDTAIDSILRYTGYQLYRLEDALKGPIDYLAWIVRNLLEASLWLQFVLESEQQATIFLEEYQVDRHDLLYKLQEADATLSKKPFNVAKPKRPLVLQRKVLYQNADYKLCCKLIHPTAWLLGRHEIFENKQYQKTLPLRKAFYSRALRYSFDITASVYLSVEMKS